MLNVGGQHRKHRRIAHVTTVDLSLRLLLLDQLHHLRKAGYDVTAISAPGPHVEHLDGIRHIPVRMTRTFTPARDLATLQDLTRILQREKFDLVHTHTPKPGLIGQIAARLAGVPVVVNTIHGFYFHDRMQPAARRFYVLMERIAATQSSAILSQNPEDIETGVRERIFRRDQVELLGNGVDLDRFHPGVDGRVARRALGIADGDKVIGFVGRLVAEKGLRELFDAFAHVRAEQPRTKLLVVGGTDGEKGDAVDARAADAYGIADACIFAGHCDDMPAMYAAMDVLALPSHREGFPRAPMEAAAMGVPSVVTDIRGCRETVVHGETGRFVPVGDVDALAGALLDLLRDDEGRRRMGAAARALAVQRFDQRDVFRRVEATYERLLA